MKKHYVIRTLSNGTVEQVFDGTLEEALGLQENWGVDEENRVKAESFNELMMKNFFGEDAKYEEVSEEEYNKAK